MQRITLKPENYILDPTHEITIALIGVGGTGSQVLNILARMHVALKALGHPGFKVMAFDGDEVSEANIGRQSFFYCDLGQNKAINMISKINMAFGLNWIGASDHYTKSNVTTNIMITCTDSIESRKIVWEKFNSLKNDVFYTDQSMPYYWIDFGNSSNYGQVIISERKKKYKTQLLKSVFEFHPELLTQKESNEPSCSMIEALSKQDLLINSTLANFGMDLLWKMFRTLEIPYNGIYLNLKDYAISTIPIWDNQKPSTKSSSK